MPILLAWWKRFVEPATNKPRLAATSYGLLFLGLLVGLCCFELGLMLGKPAPSTGDFLNLTVVAMLILNHLAYGFCWRPATTFLLRLVAWAGMLMVFVRVFLLAR